MSIFNNPNDSEIDQFLHKFKMKMSQGEYTLVNRRKNTNFLREKGISILSMEETILNLTTSNYCKGPEPDRNHIGDFIWVFCSNFEDFQIYIKLQLRDEYGWLISFHEAEHEMGGL
ncbi:type II toxin-antitoxin system MqsR family toxin [Weissella sp. MSCH1]|uniref:type II toxin-antitoxin system MqsR family toxin n=1 Tax=Weissella sp. MSCH1 TaxID=3383343 RepID=UPI0038968EBD